ncbi:MAG: PKD domain-containing protein, partial [Bacteroidia bacterium]
MKKNVLILFAFVLLHGFSIAQLDTVHWIPPLHSRDNNQVADHYVYLSTPHATPFTVTITDGSGNTIATPTISNSTPLAYQVGTSQSPASPLFVPVDSLNKVLRKSGLTLSAPFPFYANPRVRSGSQADCLTAKGRAGKGTTFRVGGFPQVLNGSSRNFTVGIMATEPNTTVTINDYDPAILFAGVPTITTPSITVTLNQGECYVISGYTNTPANLDGIIGALVQSDKPIVMNNGNLLGTIANDGSQDIGIDQSVPIEKVGKNYILIEGGGNPDMEQPIVIAHYNNTAIYINGNTSPIATINAGQYYMVPNSNYQGTGHRNMHIHTSEPAYMYQALAGSTSYATGALNFIPPYNCYMQDSIDLIPMVEKIGSTNFTGGVFVFTKQGATLTINGVVQGGGVPVLSAPWKTYKILGLTGNIKVKSTAGVAAGIFGASGAAGYAGYFSGFSDIPEPSTYSYATTTDTCHSIPINFTAHYDGQIDSLRWNFGDPSSGTNDTSSLPNPNHVFSAAGEYIVTLVVYRCENDTVVDTLRAYAIPTAGFSFSDVCYGDSVHFINTSVTDSASLPVYTWNFGDGSPVNNEKNPVHYYTSPGTYTVQLVVKGGCSDTLTHTVQIFDRPAAAFSSTDICKADSAVFTNTSAAPSDGTIVLWKWSFGDGTPVDSITLSPHHLYTTSGNYVITLSVYSSNLACSDTATDTISVFPMPVANFNLASVCFNDTVECTDLSVVSSGSISSRSWDFGDNSPLVTILHPKHKYAAAGTYTVTLIVTTNNGCKDTITKNVVVHALPVAQFTAPVNVCHGNIASFTDGSTIPNTDTIQSWSWNFADGSPLLNQQTVTGGHLYAATGTYNVSLITTSTFGCKDTITKTLFVRPKPVANFGSSKVCNGTATVFSDSSTTSAGSINAWGWDFADGGTNITQNPSHLYANAGIHNVTLIAQNTFACADTITKPVQVYFNPVANFTTQDVCLNDSVFFT